MKLALGNSLSSNKPSGGRSVALISDAFKRRVQARGGSTSSLHCMKIQLTAIKDID
tara:strand:- start:2200 stop:2367 length:168 start_codon:yes stop_codon:yes gene_type:complete